MTTTLQFDTQALFAKVDDRTLTGLLLPWGEQSRQSPTTEPILFERGTVKLPRDFAILTANVAHDHLTQVARVTKITDTDAGIEAEFKVADTEEGDELLLAVSEGKFSKLSAELKSLVRDGAKAVSAVLTGAAFVPEGAFAGASLFAIAADNELPEEEEQPTQIELTKELLANAQALLESIQAEREAQTNNPTQTPANPAEQEFAMGVPNTVTPAKSEAKAAVSKDEAIALFSAIRSGSATDEMVKRLNSAGGFATGQGSLFALADVKYDGTGSVQIDQRNPAWVGELWSGRAYVQKVIPLFGHADLTSKKAQGFRWLTKPAGATWAGNKSNVPTNTPTAELDDVTASFWAMGHDVAIEHQIFEDGFIAAYLAASVDSYAEWADNKALTDILAEASTIVADNPAGLDIGKGMSAIVDGAVQVINNNALPTFALVAPDLYKAILKTPQNNVLGYLNAALGLEDGTLASFSIRSSTVLAAGTVLVGAREAATIHELSSIVRVQAPDTVKGGIDFNAFGAEATFVHKPNALVKVTPFGA
jgi:hypothetical protein